MAPHGATFAVKFLNHFRLLFGFKSPLSHFLSRHLHHRPISQQPFGVQKVSNFDFPGYRVATGVLTVLED